MIYLSVILATYNDERFIRAAIDSILNQTYPYFELIIVNDGSTDSTADIIKGYDDERIVYIEKQNTGLPDSLNVGIAHAKYDWIARMDGDDIAFPDRFEKQVKLIRDDVDIIGGNAIRIDDDGNETSSVLVKPTKRKILIDLWLGRPIFIHPTVLVRKSLLQKVGGYDKNFLRSQDGDLWFRCSSFCQDMINIQEPLLYYRCLKTKIQPNGVIQNSLISRWRSFNKEYLPLEKDEYWALRTKVENMFVYKARLKLNSKSFNRNWLFQKLSTLTAMILFCCIVFYKYDKHPS